MAAEALVDTGAILAVLDKSDRRSASCQAAFRQVRLPLLTSEAVLTELFHLVGPSWFHKQTAWELIRSGVILTAPVPCLELGHLRELMETYSDQPMDFADATLVHLAGRESISTIITTDQKHFSVYRINGRKGFRVLPHERP